LSGTYPPVVLDADPAGNSWLDQELDCQRAAGVSREREVVHTDLGQLARFPLGCGAVTTTARY
jgi:hypothetical protein